MGSNNEFLDYSSFQFQSTEDNAMEQHIPFGHVP